MEVEKNSLRDDNEKKESNMVSATKLALKIGLVWLAYQGLKKLVTYATGYQCQCPELPAAVGTGIVSKFIKGSIEGITRAGVKGLIAAGVVMPLLSMAEPQAAPLVSDAQIEGMLKNEEEA
jgi:hypothetical protein